MNFIILSNFVNLAIGLIILLIAANIFVYIRNKRTLSKMHLVEHYSNYAYKINKNMHNFIQSNNHLVASPIKIGTFPFSNEQQFNTRDYYFTDIVLTNKALYLNHSANVVELELTDTRKTTRMSYDFVTKVETKPKKIVNKLLVKNYYNDNPLYNAKDWISKLREKNQIPSNLKIVLFITSVRETGYKGFNFDLSEVITNKELNYEIRFIDFTMLFSKSLRTNPRIKTPINIFYDEYYRQLSTLESQTEVEVEYDKAKLHAKLHEYPSLNFKGKGPANKKYEDIPGHNVRISSLSLEKLNYITDNQDLSLIDTLGQTPSESPSTTANPEEISEDFDNSVES